MNDFRFAIRQLLRSPGFSAVAILTLALGIGANAAIVTMIQTLAFKNVTAKEPEKLVGIFQQKRDDSKDFEFFSYLDFADLRSDKSVWTDLAAFNLPQVGVREGELMRRVGAALVSANYFSVLGVPPLLGRGFLDEEETKAANVVVLSFSYWQRLGGKPDILGTTLKLVPGDFTIVGVMPEKFTGSDVMPPAFFLPMGAASLLWSREGEPPPRTLTDRGERTLMLFARLRDGIDTRSANEGLKLVSEKFRVADPKQPKGRELLATNLSRFAFSNRPSRFVQKVTPLASLAMALSMTVLGIACLNLANMLLARGTARRKEIALRLAIGASRYRILRQLLCEGFLLAAIGGAAGLVISVWTTRALAHFVNGGFGFDVFQVGIPDAPVVAALLALCCLATVFFALGPAWKLASLDVNSDLKQHGAVDANDRFGRFNIKSLLVVGQLALSLALLVAATLFTRSAAEAVVADPGFSYGGHFIARIDTGLANYPMERGRQIFNQAEERVATLPGVESVSTALFVPFGQESWTRSLQIGGAPRPNDSARNYAEGKTAHVRYNTVGADYFRTIGLPLLRGRDFAQNESSSKPPFPVAIITQDLAETLWPGENPVGRNIQFPAEGDSKELVMQVVGVAPKMMWDLFEKEAAGMVLTPRGQDFHSSMRLHVRVMPNADPAAIMDLVRQTLRQIDSGIPLVEIKTLKMMHADSMSVRITKIGAYLFGSFGVVALLLSFLGVYGLKAYSVARRTREIGIRMALGATARDVVRMILGEGARISAVGLAIGLGLAIVVGKLVGGFLYGVKGFDPGTFTFIPIALALVAMFACWLPARRATRVNPMQALRCE